MINNEDNKTSSPQSGNTQAGYSFLNTNSLLFNISGLDVKRGLVVTGSTVDGFCNLLSMFCKDIEERLPSMQAAPDAQNISSFTTNVHSIKSAAAFIGADELQQKAFKLEEAGKSGDMVFINDNLNSFINYLTSLVKNINDALV